MNLRLTFSLAGAALLSACGTEKPAPRTPTYIPPPALPRNSTAPTSPAGLERVMGKNANALVQSFGPFQLDIREDGARKLQFANSQCVLDAYLYPPAAGKEFVVTYVAARLPDGRAADPATCIASLGKR